MCAQNFFYLCDERDGRNEDKMARQKEGKRQTHAESAQCFAGKGPSWRRGSAILQRFIDSLPFPLSTWQVELALYIEDGKATLLEPSEPCFFCLQACRSQVLDLMCRSRFERSPSNPDVPGSPPMHVVTPTLSRLTPFSPEARQWESVRGWVWASEFRRIVQLSRSQA